MIATCDISSLITILTGVTVFIISQYFLKLVLDPITRVRRAVADVSSAILFRQAKITNASHDTDVAQELKRASAQLTGAISEVHGYAFWSKLNLFGIPKELDARTACRCLNLIAGSASSSEANRQRLVEWNNNALQELACALDVKTQYDQARPASSDH